jgi:hypothetical protein
MAACSWTLWELSAALCGSLNARRLEGCFGFADAGVLEGLVGWLSWVAVRTEVFGVVEPEETSACVLRATDPATASPSAEIAKAAMP